MSMPELLVVTIEYVQLVAISIAPYYSCLATMSSRVPISSACCATKKHDRVR